MQKSRHASWARHLDGIADELLRLCIACDVRLDKPETIERIIRNDPTVCGRHNPIGFHKLHSLVIATYDSLKKSIDRIGPEETRLIAEAIIERIAHQRALGESASGEIPSTDTQATDPEPNP